MGTGRLLRGTLSSRRRTLAVPSLACVLTLGSVGSVTAQHPADSTSWYLPVEAGCRLYVAEAGTGPGIVILHGGWGAEHSYLHEPLRFLEGDHRLVFYDQRGSLRSPCPDSLISVSRHVEDLERLRIELGVDRLTLIGHSMGTFLAMSYLEQYPKRVGKMVLIGAILPKSPSSDEEAALYREEQAAAKAFVEREEVGAQIEREGLDGTELSAKQRTFRWRIEFAGANLFHVDRWRRMRGGRIFYSQEAGTAAGRSMGASWNFLDGLDRHRFPVTVMIGDHDIVGVGGRLHRRLLDPLEDVELVVLEDAGHNAWIDAPERFRSHLKRALAR